MKLIYPFVLSFVLLLTAELHAQDFSYFTIEQLTDVSNPSSPPLEVTRICAGTPIVLTNYASDDASYEFRDGTSVPPSPGSFVTHTYTQAGVFNIKQIVNTTVYYQDPEMGLPVGYISSIKPITVVPNTQLSVNYTLLNNQEVSFSIYDTRFDSYDVNFGDGVYTTIPRTGDTTVIHHTYSVLTEVFLSIRGKFAAGNRCSVSDVLFSVNPVVTLPQPYHPLGATNNHTAVFNGPHGLQTLHVDSTRAEPLGLAHYFQKTLDLERTFTDCIPFTSTWAGPKMMAWGSIYTFLNADDDSIRFYAELGVNYPWNFFIYDDGRFIDAVVSSKEQQTFLGVTDSVKTITFQLKSAQGDNLSGMEGVEIKLSKNYGFLKTFSFRDFPAAINYYELSGFTNSIVGQQLLTSRKLYNFAIGDEFHYEEVISNPPYSGDEYHTVLTVTDKVVSANTDTIVYNIQSRRENIHRDFQTNTESYSYTVTDLTPKYIVSDLPYYPAQPDPSVTVGVNSSIHGRLQMSFTESGLIKAGNNCWHQDMITQNSHYSFLEGVGLFSRNADISPAMNHENLVYYKKQNEEYGNRLVLSTEQRKTNPNVTLYPNPLKEGEQLHINTSEFKASRLVVYNAIGNKVLELYEPNEELKSADVSALQPGLYIVKLVNDKNEYATSKLIVK